jgi:hypothetical protein
VLVEILPRGLVDDRADVGFEQARIADVQRFHRSGDHRHHLVGDVFLDEQDAQRRAALARALEGRGNDVARHLLRFPAEELEAVVEQINATGYGLTLGLQSRIDTVRDYVEEHARVGNFYVNRNQIGAVVESQPFGGEGLSGTGPKAGGPHYVARFATERVTCIDTTAAGGNASLMAALEG